MVTGQGSRKKKKKEDGKKREGKRERRRKSFLQIKIYTKIIPRSSC